MTVFLLVVAILLAVLFFALNDGPPPSAPRGSVLEGRPAHPVRHDRAPVANHRAQVTIIEGHCHVIDGDTITIRGASIRLGGIDAPEMDHPYGRKARSTLVMLCKGQVVRAEIHEHDVHGRLVGRCYLPDGRDVAAEMVRTGHAIDWPRYSGGRYRHLEVEGVRKRLWRCDARQKGRFPRAGG
jgi:endonuclease YncB( thermonuclease family)